MDQMQVLRLRMRALSRVAPGLAARRAARLFFTPRRLPRPARERELLAAGAPLRLRSGLAAVAWGDGPTVLLVHGWEGRGTQLGAFVAPLVRAGYRVVAMDGPSHGDSPDGDATIPGFARAILSVGEEVGPLAGVIAHSFGVPTTIVALTYGLAADRVVLIAGPGSLVGVLRSFADLIGLAPSTFPHFQRQIEERAGVPVTELEIASLGPRMRVPALVIHDPADREVPFDGALAIAAHWPGARLYRAEGRGHRRILLADEVIAEALAFLTADPAFITSAVVAGRAESGAH